MDYVGRFLGRTNIYSAAEDVKFRLKEVMALFDSKTDRRRVHRIVRGMCVRFNYSVHALSDDCGP
jgi:hypothetical protein